MVHEAQLIAYPNINMLARLNSFSLLSEWISSSHFFFYSDIDLLHIFPLLATLLKSQELYQDSRLNKAMIQKKKDPIKEKQNSHYFTQLGFESHFVIYNTKFMALLGHLINLKWYIFNLKWYIFNYRKC